MVLYRMCFAHSPVLIISAGSDANRKTAMLFWIKIKFRSGQTWLFCDLHPILRELYVFSTFQGEWSKNTFYQERFKFDNNLI